MSNTVRNKRQFRRARINLHQLANASKSLIASLATLPASLASVRPSRLHRFIPLFPVGVHPQVDKRDIDYVEAFPLVSFTEAGISNSGCSLGINRGGSAEGRGRGFAQGTGNGRRSKETESALAAARVNRRFRWRLR